MLRLRKITSLNKKLKGPKCAICHQTRGLSRIAKMCRKCIRDGIHNTVYQRS